MSEWTVVREVVLDYGLLTNLDYLFGLVQKLGNCCDDLSLEDSWLLWVLQIQLCPISLPENCRANQTIKTSSCNDSDEKVAETFYLSVQLSLIQKDRRKLNYITAGQCKIVMHANQTCSYHVAGAINFLQLDLKLRQAGFAAPVITGIRLAHSLAMMIDCWVNCEGNLDTSTQLAELSTLFADWV